jgi:hypothetical protein
MDRPLDIAFHGLDSSASLQAEIRRHVEKLESRYGHLTGCRVSIEALHDRHEKGNVYEVHIVLSVPGRDLAVSQEPHHVREKRRHPNLHGTLRDAFEAAERQLQDWRGKMEGPVTPPE